MKKHTSTLRTLWVLGFVAAWASTSLAQSAEPSSPTYSWDAELVSLDQSSRTMTAKARVVGPEALTVLPRVQPGERILLTWSGFDQYASDIYRAVRQDGTAKGDARFTFPVEFVSFDPQIQYLTFKAPIPVASVELLKSLKPGEWIRATSPHRPASEKEVVTAVRPFVMSASGHTD